MIVVHPYRADYERLFARHPRMKSRMPPYLGCKAIGYWRIPLRPEYLAECEAIIEGNGRARLPGGLTVSADVEGTQGHIEDMKYEDTLPDPHNFVDPSWDPIERAQVAAYLKAGPKAAAYLGYSDCRFCKQLNGTTCRSDGAYTWPEGFAHYLEAHGVRPPAEFVEHVLAPSEHA